MVCSGSHGLDVQYESVTGEPPQLPLSPAQTRTEPAWPAISSTVPDWSACLAGHEQVCCRAGSVLHFSESLIHAGNAVLSNRARHAMFFEVVAPETERRMGWRPAYVEHAWGLTSPMLRSPRTRRPTAADQRPAFRGSRAARQILPGLFQGPAEFSTVLLNSSGITHVLTLTDDRAALRAAK